MPESRNERECYRVLSRSASEIQALTLLLEAIKEADDGEFDMYREDIPGAIGAAIAVCNRTRARILFAISQREADSPHRDEDIN